MAQELLIAFGGVEGLLDASVEELIKIKGVGKAKAILLKAAFGIALRTDRGRSSVGKEIRSLQDAVAVARPEIGYLEKEALLIILRDVRGRMLHREIIAIGTLSEVLVHPREVFQPALKHGAHSIVVCHNHPSGDPRPSKADLELTERLIQSAVIMGIVLMDHIIICRDSFYSLRKESVWK